MAEVHLTLRDRKIIAENFVPTVDRPPTIRAGTWHRVQIGTLDFVDLDEWLDLWDLFPMTIRILLRNGKRTAPGTDDFRLRSNGSVARIRRGFPIIDESDRRPWKLEDW